MDIRQDNRLGDLQPAHMLGKIIVMDIFAVYMQQIFSSTILCWHDADVTEH